MHKFYINAFNYFCFIVGKLFFSIPMPAIMHYNIAFFLRKLYIMSSVRGLLYSITKGIWYESGNV